MNIVTIESRLVEKRVKEALADHTRWTVLTQTHLRRDDGLWVKWVSNNSAIEVGTADHAVPQFWYNEVYTTDPWCEALFKCRDALMDDERSLPIIKLLGIEFP